MHINLYHASVYLSLATLFTTSWTPLSHRKMYLIQSRYNGILSNVTGMNSIPRCNDITGILPNTNLYKKHLHIYKNNFKIRI